MLPILSGAVRGMQLLHEKNLVHGDIKPDNILVNFNIEGQVVSVKLGDFGLSRFLMDGMKTPNGNQYFGFAPEDDLTVKYDIFSFGVVLFAALVFMQTEVMVTTITLESLKNMVLDGDSVSFRHWLTRYLVDQDRYYIELVVQCLQLNPDDRPSNQVIASILDRDADFVTAKKPVALFSAQCFVLRNGWVYVLLIFPGVVKKVLNEFSSCSGVASAWLTELRDCIVSSDCGKLVHVYMNRDVIRKDDFVNFINNVM